MIGKYCDAIGMDHVSLWNIKDTIGNCSILLIFMTLSSTIAYYFEH